MSPLPRSSARLVRIMLPTVLLVLAACPPGTKPPIDSGSTVDGTVGSGPGRGDGCGPADTCAAGLTCVHYFGIAGPNGPEFSSCETPCVGKAAVCPAGTSCITIADGPGSVCR
ncbi:MAG: hypothetical protein RLZZ450_4624 [Pseudomonadota bacterium]|jgi:hypothetical protein